MTLTISIRSIIINNSLKHLYLISVSCIYIFRELNGLPMKKLLYLHIVIALAISMIFISFKNGINYLPEKPKTWFPAYDFDAAAFKTASREFGPFTRWWWPGNDVTSPELKREVQMFADNGFAGVEIQPLVMGLDFKNEEQNSRVFSWDSPSFFEHLKDVMEQARVSKITVDMNAGTGWPLGGAFFDPKKSMKTLVVSDTSLNGGQLFNGNLPPPDQHVVKSTGMFMMTKNEVENDWAIVKSVIGARVVKQTEKQTVLDPASLINLTAQIKNNHLTWKVPSDGTWKLVVTWDIPSGEKPSLAASSKTNYVIDHLDTAVVNDAYNYLLGPRTGLTTYYGNPMRAVFNDSYEFHVDRLVSPDLVEVFKTINGYDIVPFLSSVFQKGYDHPTYLAAMYPGAKPPFIFDEKENWRIMYDYDAAVNEVFKNNFIKTSDRWMKAHGLLHRTQAYGFPTDLIGNAGAADIPEAEQLFAEGSEGYLKLVSSGAHLNNHPVVTQESFVSIYRAEMTTPQKIKIWADKSLACGINQLIYHGTPYKYNHGEFGAEGWNTWSSPYNPFINFSTGMNESDPFWKDIKTINQYLARCQYALRSGKPKTDVLIYTPFIDFTEDQIALNPEEILNRGYFKGVEPDITGSGVFEAPNTSIHAWYTSLWKIVNELESKGITWEFVNDASLKKAGLANGQIRIEGNSYQALILANLPYMNLKTAERVNGLSKLGMKIWFVGELPKMQPSYYNYKVNDIFLKKLIEESARQSGAVLVKDELPVSLIEQEIAFSNPVHFSRQITRQMHDGSELKFIWNKSDQWQTISLSTGKHFSGSYWMNTENASIEKNNGSTSVYHLPPYGSVIFYASKNKSIAASLLSAPAPIENNASPLLQIEKWDFRVGDQELKNMPLTDWREKDSLKYKSGEGIYNGTFHLDQVIPGKHYFIDLGSVYFTATVMLNGKEAGRRIFAPYSLEITNLLRIGENNIEIRVVTTRRNGFTGEALKNNPFYAQFKGKENILMPSGLVGPVTIKIL